MSEWNNEKNESAAWGKKSDERPSTGWEKKVISTDEVPVTAGGDRRDRSYGDRGERSYGGDRGDRGDRGERNYGGDRGDRGYGGERSYGGDRGERSYGGDRNNNDRGYGGDRNNNDRGDRGDRRNFGDRGGFADRTEERGRNFEGGRRNYDDRKSYDDRRNDSNESWGKPRESAKSFESNESWGKPRESARSFDSNDSWGKRVDPNDSWGKPKDGAFRDSTRAQYSDENRRPRRDRPVPEPCKVIGMFGISVYATENDIAKFVADNTDVKHEDLNVIVDRNTGNIRGFAFLRYASIEEATKAKADLHGRDLLGNSVKCDFSISERKQRPREDEKVNAGW